MPVILAFVIGGLYAAAIYLLLRRSLVRLLIGLSLLGHAANLLIFTVRELTRARPPIVPAEAVALAAPYADPVPQSLVLTAIVIGFGVLAFALALAYRTHKTLNIDDLDQLRGAED
jgi:multicomponent Na+:H+ antiporter subunit C